MLLITLFPLAVLALAIGLQKYEARLLDTDPQRRARRARRADLRPGGYAEVTSGTTGADAREPRHVLARIRGWGHARVGPSAMSGNMLH